MQNHQADSPLYAWPDVWSADLHLLVKSMVIHDTECPYWDQVSLNNTNLTKPNHLMWPDVWSGDLQDYKKYMVIYNTECRYKCDQVSLNSTNTNPWQSEYEDLVSSLRLWDQVCCCGQLLITLLVCPAHKVIDYCILVALEIHQIIIIIIRFQLFTASCKTYMARRPSHSICTIKTNCKEII